MFFQKIAKTLRNPQGGGFPSIEARLVPFLFMVALSIFITHYHLGIWQALLKTLMWMAIIIGGFFGLIFLLVGFGKLVQFFSPKRPKGPSEPPPDEKGKG